jgi:splicing factor, arginine/serine-rich 1
MTRVYVGNLPMDVKEREIDDIFYKYGRITDIQIKRPDRPPAFGQYI